MKVHIDTIMNATRLKLILVIWISLIGLSTQGSDDKKLYIGDDCENYKIHHVNKEETYTVVWNGGRIPNYCSIGFIGRDDGYMNEYKVCVEADTWRLSNCGAKVKLEKGVVSVLAQVYSCFDPPSRWCGDSDDYVDIMFESTSTFTSGQDEIRLKVTATMTYNYTLTVGIAVGGCIGGLFFLVLAIVLISRVRGRRRVPVILTSGYSSPSQAQGLTNPVMYSTTSGSYPDNSKPPPSYESVMNTSPYAPPPPPPTNIPVSGS